MKLLTLNEPTLSFAGDKQHVDIRAGITLYGPFDNDAPSVPVPIRVGVIGTTATADGVRDWLEQCKAGVASDEVKLRELRPAFPGMTSQSFGTTLELSDSTTRTISRHELSAALTSADPLRSCTDLFVDHARDLSNKSGLHVLVIAPPPEVFDLADTKKKAEEPPLDDAQEPVAEQESPEPTPFNFHDGFKAQALDLQLPCQILRPDTYGYQSSSKSKGRKLQDRATRAWNFHTALYYKAGGVPWRLARQPSTLMTCYVGVSFFKSISGDRMMTSVAQIFDERGEGLIVQGASASFDKDDRTPHLGANDAYDLLTNGLATYRREHKTTPARLVLHKTSSFNDQEKDGFRRAASGANLEVLDLVSVWTCPHF